MEPKYLRKFSQQNILILLLPLIILHDPSHISLRAISILSSHSLTYFPNRLHPLAFPTRTLHTFIFTVRATCSAILILLDFVNPLTFVQENTSRISYVCNFLQTHLTSSILTTNVLLSTIFLVHPQPVLTPQHERLNFAFM